MVFGETGESGFLDPETLQGLIRGWFEDQCSVSRLLGNPGGGDIFDKAPAMTEKLEAIQRGETGARRFLAELELPFEEVPSEQLAELAGVALDKLRRETHTRTPVEVSERITSYVKKAERLEDKNIGSGEQYIRDILVDVDGQIEILEKSGKGKTRYQPLFGFTLADIKKVREALQGWLDT